MTVTRPSFDADDTPRSPRPDSHRVADRDRSPVGDLLRDPVLTVILSITVLLALPYFLPIFDQLQLAVYGAEIIDKLQLIGVLAAILIGFRRIRSVRERRFWRLLAVAIAIWLTVRIFFTARPDLVATPPGDIAGDLLYLLFYTCMFLATEIKPDRPFPGALAVRLRRFDIIAAAVFVVGAIVYFVIVPSAMQYPAYTTWVPSLNVYLALDALLIVRFSYLAITTPSKKYRWIYGLFAVAALNWLVTDLIECLDYAGKYHMQPGTRWDLLWWPEFVLVTLAARLRHVPFPDDGKTSDRVDPSTTLRMEWTTVVLAFLLPVMHFALDGLGVLGPETHDVRALVVLGALVAFGIILSWQHYRVHRTQRALQADLDEANARLQHSQKMEAVGRLAGGVAHDFNNLLTAISGHSQMLLSRLDGRDSLRRGVEEIERAAQRAAALTRQLLAFSRRQFLQPRVLDLNTVVADMDQMLRRLIGEDVRLITGLDADAGRVRADRSQLEQVIVNLAVNARDAMPEGGTLTLGTTGVTVLPGRDEERTGLAAGRHVLLSIADTGCGIDAELRDRVFEPFFTTKEQGKGTGLGLAMVYGIVKQSGGAIWFETEKGVGTTFHVCLPAAAGAEDRAVETEPAEPAREGAGATILLVEDEDTVRNLVRQVLESRGYRVLEAQDGDRAFEIQAEHDGPIELLLTDVVMPRMGGPELAERLREVRPDIKVLYMSGYHDLRTFDRRGLEQRGDAYLEKPFGPRILTAQVREVLNDAAKPESVSDRRGPKGSGPASTATGAP